MRKAHDAALKYIRGFMVTESILALSNIGILDDFLCLRYLDAESYARNKNLDGEALKTLFDYLYSLRILNKSNNGYCLSKTGRLISEYAKGPFDFAGAYAPIFQDLELLLKKKKRYGSEIKKIDFLVAKASFETEKWLPYPVVKELIKKYNYKGVLDLGCGSARFLIEACKDNPGLMGFGIDKSADAIEYANKEVVSAGLKEGRIELRHCDIFDINSLPKSWPENVDVVTSMFVLHEFINGGSGTKVANLLKTLKEYFKNASFIICELCRNTPEQLRKRPSLIAEHHLFHALSKQQILTYAEWKKIFRQASLNIIEEIRFKFAEQGYFILK